MKRRLSSTFEEPKQSEETYRVVGAENEEVCFGMLADVPYIALSCSDPGMDHLYTMPLTLQPDSADLFYAGTQSVFGQLDSIACKILNVLLKEPSIKLQVQTTRPKSIRLPNQHINASSKRVSKSTPQPQLQVNIYGAKYLFDSVGTFVSRCHYFLQQPQNCDHNVEYCNPHCLSPENPEPVFTNDLEDPHYPETFRAQALYLSSNPIDAFTDTSNCNMLPETDTPAVLRTSLYKHQKQALTFMIRREEGWAMDKAQQDIWKYSTDAEGKPSYTNIVTGHVQRRAPAEFRGGLLIDAPGLGKTLSMISLLAFSKQLPPITAVAKPLKTTTLLVVPKTLIETWKDELKRHLMPNTISFCDYYGPGRAKVFDQLHSYDLVITTFSVVRRDWKTYTSQSEGQTTLHSIEWHRVILDEAHIIREPTKSFAMSVCALNAPQRWCITGTPIQNRLLDIFSLFKFLKCSPFDDLRVFRSHVSRDGRNLLDSNSIPKLKILVNCLSLRRPKSTVHLLPRDDVVKLLQFTARERQFYENIRTSATRQISVAAETRNAAAFLNALHRVNELRLVCNHGIRNGDIHQAQDFADTIAPEWTMEAAQLLFDEMDSAGLAICSAPGCHEDISSKLSSETDLQKGDEPRLDQFSNLFCSSCCRNHKVETGIFYSVCHHLPRCPSAKPTQAASPASSFLEWDCKQLPTKIEAIVRDLAETAAGVKSVVFSSWSRTFDLIQPALISRSIRCIRLDGKTSTLGRAKILQTFRDDPDMPVLLATITCGGVGLNLTAASRAYIMEPQWNPMSESQALDRIHRLGQEQEVQTIRYLMEGTWEEKIVELQKHKQKLADVTLGEDSNSGGGMAFHRLEYLKDIVERKDGASKA